MGDVSRRTLLGGGVGAAGLVALGLGDAATAAPATAGPLRSHYAKSVGKVFTATRGGRTVKVRLVAIRTIGPTRQSQLSRSFTLVWAPTGGGRLQDGTYVLRRRRVQTHTLSLSSVGTSRRMQAVINRTV